MSAGYAQTPVDNELPSIRQMSENESGPEVQQHLRSGPSPHHSNAPRSEMDPILPPAADLPQQTPASIHAERMGRVDGCPTACGNYVPPRIVCEAVAGFRAYYVCTDCGHDWFTEWRDR